MEKEINKPVKETLPPIPQIKVKDEDFSFIMSEVGEVRLCIHCGMGVDIEQIGYTQVRGFIVYSSKGGVVCRNCLKAKDSKTLDLMLELRFKAFTEQQEQGLIHSNLKMRETELRKWKEYFSPFDKAAISFDEFRLNAIDLCIKSKDAYIKALNEVNEVYKAKAEIQKALIDNINQWVDKVHAKDRVTFWNEKIAPLDKDWDELLKELESAVARKDEVYSRLARELGGDPNRGKASEALANRV